MAKKTTGNTPIAADRSAYDEHLAAAMGRYGCGDDKPLNLPREACIVKLGKR